MSEQKQGWWFSLSNGDQVMVSNASDCEQAEAAVKAVIGNGSLPRGVSTDGPQDFPPMGHGVGRQQFKISLPNPRAKRVSDWMGRAGLPADQPPPLQPGETLSSDPEDRFAELRRKRDESQPRKTDEGWSQEIDE